MYLYNNLTKCELTKNPFNKKSYHLCPSPSPSISLLMSEFTQEIADLKQENANLKVQLNVVIDLHERTAIRGQISANTSRITFLEQQQFVLVDTVGASQSMFVWLADRSGQNILTPEEQIIFLKHFAGYVMSLQSKVLSIAESGKLV